MNVPFLSWCNGKLTINKENKPTYVDRIVKSMLVRNPATRRELVEKIYQISKINPNDYLINVTCRWPIYIKNGWDWIVGSPKFQSIYGLYIKKTKGLQVQPYNYIFFSI